MALEQHQQRLPDATFEEIEFGRVDAYRQLGRRKKPARL
jgi:hypothetical protein